MRQSTAPAIVAERLRMSSRGRTVFGPVTFEARAGALVAILGASGSGKTALLLTLAGRMRGWSGRASFSGIDLRSGAAAVRRRIGLGVIASVNDLTPSLTAVQHVMEQRLFVPRTERSPVTDVLSRVELTDAADVPVRDLDAEQQLRLGIALALVRDVDAIAIDDLDASLNREQRTRILALLRVLTADGIACVFACIDAETAARADVVVRLAEERQASRERRHIHAVA